MYAVFTYFSTCTKSYRKPKQILKEIEEFIICGKKKRDDIIAYWAVAQTGWCFCILLLTTTWDRSKAKFTEVNFV